MKKQFFFIILILCVFHAKAQVAQFIYFNKVLSSDTMNILAQAIQPIEDGYLTLGGYATSENYVLYIRKLNLTGETDWIKPFEIIENLADLGIIEWGGQVRIVNNSLIAVYERAKNICFTKFNLDGDTILHKKYIQSGWQLGKQIISTPDNGFIIAGMEQNSTVDTVKAYALKIDSEGNFEWDKRYLMGNDARFFTVQHTPWDGGFIFGGMGYSATTGYDMFVVKTTANGDTLWTKRYGSSKNDCAGYVVPLTTYQEYLNGVPIEYLLTGCWESTEPDPLFGHVDYLYIAKINEMGDIIWEHNYTSLAKWLLLQTPPIIAPDKSFIGTGFYLTNGYTPSTKVLKFDSNGTIAWQKNYTLNPDKSCYLKDLQPTTNGGYVLAGYQYSSPQTAWVLKIDSLGNTCSYIGCDSTVVVEVLPGIPSNSTLAVEALVYPVPASTHLFIRYQIPAGILPSGGSMWRLYDSLGRQVVEETLQGNEGVAEVSVAHLPVGIYYYRVVLPTSGQAVASGKILVSEK
ncbi:MAG: T9SS type A sorting domain-containing protein [Sphingobacteriales bacterium]|nr:MAG: T9SS type A sorting domain-containing protein [Sphingobacteriales bacterium]